MAAFKDVINYNARDGFMSLKDFFRVQTARVKDVRNLDIIQAHIRT